MEAYECSLHGSMALELDIYITKLHLNECAWDDTYIEQAHLDLVVNVS